MKRIACLIVIVAFSLIAAVSAFAEPSAKFAAQVKDLTIVPASSFPGVDCDNAANYVTVLNTSLKTPNKKDLLIGASFQTGLYTQTKVQGKTGSTDTATASGTLKVKVFVDDSQNLVEPDAVVYDHRLQSLSATFGGVIQECTDTGDFSVVEGACIAVDADPLTDGIQLAPDGTITVQCECVVTDEMIDLILDTLAAHHFNFVAKDLSAGSHTIKVMVCGTTDTSAGAGSASATVTVGPGSLTVEEVRATNTGTGIEFLQ